MQRDFQGYGIIESKRVPLTADEGTRRTVVNRLMCQLKLDFASLNQGLGIDFTDYFATSLRDMRALIDDYIVKTTDTRLADK